MTNELTVINQSDVELVAQQVPQAYKTNLASHDACLNYGQKLLARVQAEGMSDELDAELSLYITKSKATVKKINDLRSPATKLFDQFKKVFTTMENDIDVSKSGSVPFQIQAHRNQYAAKKREEEERRRAEEMRRQQTEQARKQYATDCEEEIVAWLSASINDRINHLTDLFSTVTLANFAQREKEMRTYPVTLPEDWDAKYTSIVRLPSLLPADECRQMRIDIRFRLMVQRLSDEYKFAVENERDDLLAKLPSKKKELEKIAAAEAANAAEAARIKAEMEAKERADAAAREQERREKEEEARKAAEAAKAADAVGCLFDQAAASQSVGFPVKASVKKVANVLNPEGFLDIIGLWWEYVGKNMTVDALKKEFSKQVTFCNKMANDATNPIFLHSEHIEYVEEVKAK